MNSSNDVLLTKSATVSRPTTLPLICLILGAIGIGFAPIFVRLSEVGPFATGFWRVTLALPMLMLISSCQSRKGEELGRARLSDYLWLLLSGVFFAADLAVWHLSINYTSVANATMLANFTPLLIALWGWLVLKKRPKIMLICGLLLAFTGMILLINPHAGTTHKAMLGNICGLGAAVFYTGYFLIINQVRLRFNTYTLMAWSAFGSMITLWLITWISGQTFFAGSLTAWSVLFALAFISQVLGQSLIAYALPFLSLSFSSVVLFLQPMVAAMVAWILFAEALAINQLYGILVALLGIYITRVNS